MGFSGGFGIVDCVSDYSSTAHAVPLPSQGKANWCHSAFSRRDVWCVGTYSVVGVDALGDPHPRPTKDKPCHPERRATPAVEVLRSGMSGAKPREHSDRRDLLWRTRNLLTRCNIHSTCKKGYTHSRKATENSLVYPKSAPALLLVKTRNSLRVFSRSTSQRATGTFAALRMTQ